MTDTKHLWEVEHDYYCNDANYYANDTVAHFRSWQAFAEAEGGACMDMNLVFRWDWREGGGWELGSEYTGDDNYRNGLLCVYLIGQRKGLFRSAQVEVCRADEPAVRAYLEPRFRNLMELWAPFTLEPATP